MKKFVCIMEAVGFILFVISFLVISIFCIGVCMRYYEGFKLVEKVYPKMVPIVSGFILSSLVCFSVSFITKTKIFRKYKTNNKFKELYKTGILESYSIDVFLYNFGIVGMILAIGISLQFKKVEYFAFFIAFVSSVFYILVNFLYIDDHIIKLFEKEFIEDKEEI